MEGYDLFPMRGHLMRRHVKLRGYNRLGFESLEQRRLLTSSGDFNGDGFADLVVAAPEENLPNPANGDFFGNAGAVHVIYGSASGLTSTGNQFWNQNSPGVDSNVNSIEYFGAALAVGDFNRDGFDDLAIGAPGDVVDGHPRAGSVYVMFGSAQGLRTVGDQYWTSNSPGIKGNSRADDHFGQALAAGDFDNDGFDDLAIGVPGKSVVVSGNSLGGNPTTVVGAGAITVLFGSKKGLTGSRSQTFDQNTAGIDGIAREREAFGSVLEAADFNGDGADDLAIGTPLGSIAGVTGAGVVNVLYGGARKGIDGLRGLTASGDQLFQQNTPGIGGSAGEGSRFGEFFATGDFNDDGIADLATTARFDQTLTNGTPGDGSVHILYGSKSKIDPAESAYIVESDFGLPGNDSGYIGLGLATADFNHDGIDDLAIRATSTVTIDMQGHNTVYNQLLFATGHAAGIGTSPTQVYRYVGPESLNYGPLAAGDYDGNGFADLVAANPEAAAGTGNPVHAGQVSILYNFNGFSPSAVDEIVQGEDGILDTAENGDFFGSALA
jgi:hypothetical protein